MCEEAQRPAGPAGSAAVQLSVDSLLNMSPMFNGQDLVTVASRQLFLNHVRSQKTVQEVFFPNHQRDRYEDKIDDSWFDFEYFSVLYVCNAICQYKDEYGISSMLNEEKVAEHLQECYDAPDWKKIGFAIYRSLFPDLVKDSENGYACSFRVYMEHNRRYWGGELAEKVKDGKWLHTVVTSICRDGGENTEDEYNAYMNTLFVKLYLLDESLVMPTYDHIKKALPDLNLNLVTTNYLSGPLDWQAIKPDLDLALNKATYPRTSSKLAIEDLELFYGVNVVEFITHDAKDLGLVTGRDAHNKRVSRFRDRCIVMGHYMDCCVIL